MLAGVSDVRPAEGPYEKRLDQAIHYFFYADKFHWSSDQVDNERAWLLDAYETIAAARDEARDRAQRQETHRANLAQLRQAGRRR